MRNRLRRLEARALTDDIEVFIVYQHRQSPNRNPSDPPPKPDEIVRIVVPASIRAGKFGQI